MAEATLSRLAPAKVNLFLHVGAPRADGYHPLSSLVAFADVGDVVTVAPSDRLSLTVIGPLAAGLAGEGDNLILKALRALGERCGVDIPLAVTLDKRLPIAAGLGGGSSDAAAALRLANDALSLGLDEAALEDVARVIGADGPMCLRGRSAYAEGIGDVLTEVPDLPPLPAVLHNPGRPSSTGAVYRAYDADVRGDARRPIEPPAWTPSAVIDWLGGARNDLQPPAVALEPTIGQALDRMTSARAMLTRMSGSGATVFGLFDDMAAARRAAAQLDSKSGPGWTTVTLLGGQQAA